MNELGEVLKVAILAEIPSIAFGDLQWGNQDPQLHRARSEGSGVGITSDFFCWKAMDLYLKLLASKHSHNHARKLRTVLKKNTTDITFFLESSSFVCLPRPYIAQHNYIESVM